MVLALPSLVAPTDGSISVGAVAERSSFGAGDAVGAGGNAQRDLAKWLPVGDPSCDENDAVYHGARARAALASDLGGRVGTFTFNAAGEYELCYSFGVSAAFANTTAPPFVRVPGVRLSVREVTSPRRSVAFVGSSTTVTFDGHRARRWRRRQVGRWCDWRLRRGGERDERRGRRRCHLLVRRGGAVARPCAARRFGGAAGGRAPTVLTLTATAVTSSPQPLRALVGAPVELTRAASPSLKGTALGSRTAGGACNSSRTPTTLRATSRATVIFDEAQHGDVELCIGFGDVPLQPRARRHR